MALGATLIFLFFTYLAFAAPIITYVSPTLSDNATSGSNWIYVNATITEAINQTIMEFNSVNYTIYEPSLVLNLPFNENSGTTAYDNSPYGNNGVLRNGSLTCANSDCPAWVFGRYGSALQLDGANDYVGIPDSASLNQSFSAISISFWFKTPTTLVAQADNAGFVSKTNTTIADYGVYVAANTENIRAGFSNGSGTFFTVDTEGFAPSLNEWHQVVWVFNSTHNLIYVNGALNNASLAAGAQTVRSSDKGLAIGAITTAFFNGTIDGVRIYNRSLSAAEIAQQYNISFGKYYANFTNLADGNYNYTIFTQNTTGEWNQTQRRFVYIDTTPPYSLYACQDLTIENGSYILMQNVSSAGTCFNILANNITLDGAGYAINYSQSATGYAINNSLGYDSITVKNLNIEQGGTSSSAYAILFNGSANSAITNSTIHTKGTWGASIYLYASSSNAVSNNSLITDSNNGNTLYVELSDSNAISGSNITGTGGAISNPSATIYIHSSNGNSISGGSVAAKVSTYAYHFKLENATINNFTNTNFTDSTKIRFIDSTSYFTYNNRTNGNIWLSTRNSAGSAISRTLITWSNNTMKWNETPASAMAATYNLTGLLPSTSYAVYNASGSAKTKAYLLNTDASGALSFTIDLSSETQIQVQALNLSSCQDLDLPETYNLAANVSSAGTCFTIKADNVTLDGSGYTINYSQSATGYAINNTLGYNFTTIKNANILKNTTQSFSFAIYFSGASNGTIQNNTIAISGADSYGVLLEISSNSNTLANNTITTSGSSGVGILLYASSNSNTLLNNIITTSGAEGLGIFIFLANLNTLSNNTITTLNPSASGIYLLSSSSNNISGGSIVAQQAAAYSLEDSGTTNNFTNTNFTALRNITFYDSTSWFNYRNDSSNNIWLKTNVSAAGSINRTLVTWSNSTMKWNDTNGTAALVARYNLTGLLPNTNYVIYNTSAGVQTKSYASATDSNGALSFTITLNGNTQIQVQALNLTSCGDLDLPETYTLVANVSSVGTCFTIKADNVTLDGAGYTINYSQQATGFAINNTLGYDNITIKNLNIINGNSSTSGSHAIELLGTVNSFIYNNSITTTGANGFGIYLYSGSTGNIVRNNNISISGSGTNYGILIYSNSHNNTLINNNIMTAFPTGIRIQSSSNNSVINGSISSSTASASIYQLYAAGTTNNFTNTNFTATRRITYYDNLSWFNYNNGTDNIWLKTRVTTDAVISLNRTLITWSQSMMKWNDTNISTDFTTEYNLTGLFPNSMYAVYNTSGGAKQKSYLMTTDSAGILPSFTITLNSETQIQVQALNLSACGDLDLPETYNLVANVSSAGTCFNVKSDNVTLDGAGYTVNYSQSAMGYAINNSLGYNFTTIKNVNLLQGSASASSYAIYFNGALNGTIQNNTIATFGSSSYGISLESYSNSNNVSDNAITTYGFNGRGIWLSSSAMNNMSGNRIVTLGENGHGIYFWSSSNSNRISNNTINTSHLAADGILVYSSNDSALFNNTITTSGESGHGIFIWRSNSSNLSGNLVKTSNATAYGVYIYSGLSNNIADGSVISAQSSSYYLRDAGTTNNFTNTNFTALRNITFYDSTSWFNYRNDSSNNIWLKTNVSAAGSINRTLVTWSQSQMKWNDTNGTAGLTMRYNLTDLLASTTYAIYNISSGTGTQTNSYNLTANSLGELPSFTIDLNENTEIAAYAQTPINITSGSGTYSMMSQANFTATIDRPKIGLNTPVNGTLDIYIVSYNGTRYEAELNDSGSWVTTSLNLNDILLRQVQARWNTSKLHNGTYTAYVVFDYNESGAPMHTENSTQFTISATYNATIAYKHPLQTKYNWTDTFSNVTIIINNTGNTELCDISGECELYIISHANQSSNDHLFTTTTGHATGWTVVNSTSCSASPINVSSSIECTAYKKDFQFNSDAPAWTTDNHTFNLTFTYDSSGMADNQTFIIEIVPSTVNITLKNNVASNVEGKNFSSNENIIFNSEWKQSGGYADYGITEYVNLTKDPEPAPFQILLQNATLPVSGNYISNDISWQTGQLEAGTYYAKYSISDMDGTPLNFTLLGESSERTAYTATFYISPTKDARILLDINQTSNYSVNENVSINGTIWRRGNINFTGNLDINITGPAGTFGLSSCDRTVDINSTANATFLCIWNTSNYLAGTYNFSATLSWDSSNSTINWTLFNISQIKAAEVSLASDKSSYNMSENISAEINISDSGNSNVTGNLTLSLIGPENKVMYSENNIELSTATQALRNVIWNVTNTLQGSYTLNASYRYLDSDSVTHEAWASKAIAILQDKSAVAEISSDKQTYGYNENVNFTFNMTTGGNTYYTLLNYNITLNNSVGMIESSSWSFVERNATVQSSYIWNTASWPAGDYNATLDVSDLSGNAWTANTTFTISSTQMATITNVHVDKELPLYYNYAGDTIYISSGRVNAIGNTNFTGNLTMQFKKQRTGIVQYNETCEGFSTSEDISTCLASIATSPASGWDTGRMILNVSFAYNNGSDQIAVNQTEFRIGTTAVDIKTRDILGKYRNSFFKNEVIYVELSIENTTDDPVSGLGEGNITATISGIGSVPIYGWTETSPGIYLFNIGAWNLGTYSLSVDAYDPFEGSSGTDIEAFEVGEHSVVIIMEANDFASVINKPRMFAAATNTLNNTAAGIIHQGKLFSDVSSPTPTSITLDQKLEGNKAYLVFTKGTWQTINNRMPDVLSGAFEKYLNPSFGFPLSDKYRITVGIEYLDKGINITDTSRLSPGIYTFVVKNEGVQDGKTVISIKRKT